jgi:hypothetical protein
MSRTALLLFALLALDACAPTPALASPHRIPAATVWVDNRLIDDLRVYLHRPGGWYRLGYVRSGQGRCLVIPGHTGEAALVAKIVVGGGRQVASPSFSLGMHGGWTWRVNPGAGGGLDLVPRDKPCSHRLA